MNERHHIEIIGIKQLRVMFEFHHWMASFCETEKVTGPFTFSTEGVMALFLIFCFCFAADERMNQCLSFRVLLFQQKHW
jgi:hypothetical protein